NKDRAEQVTPPETAAIFERILRRAAEDAKAGGLSLAKAHAYLKEMIRANNPEFGGVSVDTYLQAWISEKALRTDPSTVAVCQLMRRRFTAAFGPKVSALPLTDLTREHVESAL